MVPDPPKKSPDFSFFALERPSKAFEGLPSEKLLINHTGERLADGEESSASGEAWPREAQKKAPAELLHCPKKELTGEAATLPQEAQ